METYEAIVSCHPGTFHIPGIQGEMKEDLAKIREKLRHASIKARKMTVKMEQVLAQDEAVNGWKGEERFVEMF